MDLAAALAALNGAASIVTSIRNIDHQLSTAELKLKMADVTGFLADAKIELAQAKEETVQLNDRIKELQSFIAKKENLVETEGFLYDANDGKPIGLPYCPACQAKLGVFIRIAKTGPSYDDLACPGCRFAYKDDLTRSGQ
jgi:hypothetical protein